MAGRYFPSSLRSLAQADSCQQMIKHYVSGKCPACPTELRQELVARSSSTSTVLSNNKSDNSNPTTTSSNKRVKYGSRIIFFRRIWERLHGSGDGTALEGDNDDDKADKPTITEKEEDESKDLSASTDGKEPNHGDEKDVDHNQESPKTAPSKTTPPAPATTEIDWDRLLGDNSSVVNMDDKGLVAESQWAAIAQMKPCQLTAADRIGWFKNRPLGFGGLCCKW
jgi:hypothetical protein